MSDMIDDNRFVLIEKYKWKLIEGTNIESRPEEMEVLDSILFRFWQMGWLDKLEEEPHWIPVEQELPEYGKAVLTITQDETYEVNHVIDEECGEWFWEDNGKVIAWMPLPEPFKGVTE